MGGGGTTSTFSDPLQGASQNGQMGGSGTAQQGTSGNWIAPAVNTAAGLVNMANIGANTYGDLEKPGFQMNYTAMGASMGATVGSIIPGVGTAVGAGVGAAAGLVGDTVSYIASNKKFEREKRAYNVREWRDRLNQDSYRRDATGVFYMRHGGSVNMPGMTPHEMEDKEIVIMKQADGSYSEVLRTDGFPSHEAGGKTVNLPQGAQVFNRHLYKEVEDAMLLNDWSGIESNLIPARDAMLRSAKSSGDPYATGEESKMGGGGEVKYGAGGTNNGWPEMPTGMQQPGLVATEPNDYAMDTSLMGGTNDIVLGDTPGMDVSFSFSGATDTMPTDKKTGVRDMTSGDVHNIATAANLMFSLTNAFKQGPPPVRFDKPVAHLARYDNRPVRSAYQNTLGALNTAQKNVNNTVRSVGDVVAASGLATAGILDAQNNAAMQELQGLQQVEFANAQVRTQVEGARTETGNRERAMNAEISAQDRAMRSEAVTQNLNAAFDNQLNRLQEEQMAEQARRNELISLEAMKLAAETDAFSSEDFDRFKSTQQQQAFDAVTKEMGDKGDLSNPVYKDQLPTWTSQFDGAYSHPEQIGAAIKNAEAELATATAMPDGDEKTAAMTAAQTKLEQQQAAANDYRNKQLESFQYVMAGNYYEKQRAERVVGSASEDVLREKFRSERGLPKSNLSALMNMLNN